MMSAEKIGILAVITNKQGSELVNLSKTAFAGETLLVNGSIEKTIAPVFDRFPVTLVLPDIGNDSMVEANLAGLQSVKGAVSLEERSGNRQSQTLHRSKGGLQMGVADLSRRSESWPMETWEGFDDDCTSDHSTESPICR